MYIFLRVRTNTKFVFSLATATGLVFNSQIVEADILGSLKHANELYATLNQNPTAWPDAARSFLAAFDEFDQGLRDVLDAEGAIPMLNTAILVEIWKKGRTFPRDFTAESFLKEETIEGLPVCSPYWWHGACCATDGGCFLMLCFANPLMNLVGMCVPVCISLTANPAPHYYFKDHVEPLLKRYIFSSLRVGSLREAALFWERNFVAPVSQLLIDHAAEMKTDDGILQILLDLYRSYHLCDAIAFIGPNNWASQGVFTEEAPQSIRLKKFTQVYQVFYDELADAILAWTTPGEGENTLCGLLLENEGKSKIGTKYYYGTERYKINIVTLVTTFNKRLTMGGQSASAAIAQAIGVAQQRCKQWQERIDARIQGEAAGAAAGAAARAYL